MPLLAVLMLLMLLMLLSRTTVAYTQQPEY